MLFGARYQYALHTTSFAEQPVSDRTLSRFRERLHTYEQETGIDLMKDEMESLADAFVPMLGISGQMKRMDYWSLRQIKFCKVHERPPDCQHATDLRIKTVGGLAKGFSSR